MARVNLQIVETSIPGVMVIEPAVFGDGRGFFMELFNADRYAAAGITTALVQDNLSRSARGVLRGLHLQNPHPQGKLVTALRGSVLDVAVDVRLGSPSFGQHVKMELSEESRRQLWMPRGFAHGFVVVSEVAEFLYKCDELYRSADERRCASTIRSSASIGGSARRSSPNATATAACCPNSRIGYRSMQDRYRASAARCARGSRMAAGCSSDRRSVRQVRAEP